VTNQPNKLKGYWLNRDAKDVADKLCNFYNRIHGEAWNPLYATWVRNTYAYYSSILETDDTYTSLIFSGEQGELVKMMVPQARCLARQLVTLTCKQKLAFKSISSRDNIGVIQDMRIADAIGEEIVYEQEMDKQSSTMVERGLVMGTAFMRAAYRTDRGKPSVATPHPTDPNKAVLAYEGKLEITTPHVMDMLYNFTLPRWLDNEWCVCRVRRNRWALIEQHPELESEILKLPSIWSSGIYGRQWLTMDEDDEVYCYELWALDTPGCNGGRMMMYASPTCIFYDDYNTINEIPIEQYKPEPIEGIGFGYPMFSNLLPAQEMFDHEMSTTATNHSAYGLHNVVAPRNAGVDVQELFGLNLVSYTPTPGVPGGGKPEKLDLLTTGPETMAFADKLLSNMQVMANINAALRGDLAATASGVAIATLTTNALEFISAYGAENVRVMERVMGHAIRLTRAFMPEEKQVLYNMQMNRSISRIYKRENLDSIKGFRMQAVNPLMQSYAGRIEIADKAGERGFVKNMQDFTKIIDGEPLSSLFESDSSENDLITIENERLLNGEEPQVLASDRHPEHTYSHKKLLNDPRVREDVATCKRIEDHLAKHLEQAKLGDPLFQAMCATGKMPDMAAMQGQPPPGPDGGGGINGGAGQPAESSPLANTANADEVSEPELGPAAEAVRPGGKSEAQPAMPARDLLGRR
jgi:hypothetical protein